MKLSRKFAPALRVAVILALGAALVPMLAGPATAQGYEQATPFSDTVAAGNVCNGQLNTTGGTGGDVYVQQDGAPNLNVSPSGAVTAPDTLPVGTYTADGSVTDNSTDTVPWTFELSVTGTLTQGAPTSGATPAGTALSDQLAISNGTPAYTYTQSPSSAYVTVSPSGAVSTPDTDPVGTYPASGGVTDSQGNTGTWTYSVTVTAVLLTQGSPTAGSTAAGTPLSDQLAISNGMGPYGYTQSSGSPDVSVSSTGAVSAPDTDPVGVYQASGGVIDSLGDTGNWSYTVTVDAVTITQIAPTTGTTTAPASSGFEDQLATSNNNGTVNFTQSSGTPAVTVSSAGVVSTSGTLGVGTYTASGSDTDSLGDTGNWSFTLTVSPGAISQSAPTSNSTTPAASSGFTQQLATSGNKGAVSFVPTGSGSTPSGVVVSSSGLVSTKGALSVGTYTISGTDSDTYGDTGIWSYSLKVTSSAITQDSPFSNAKTVAPATSAAFTDKLKTSVASGSVKFVTTGSGSTPPGVVVSSSGVVSTKGALAVGTYSISGSDSDSLNDEGSWSFTLTVTATKITQAAPNTATTTTGKAFSGQLKVSGSYGRLSFLQSARAPELKVSSSGAASAPASLRAGKYKASGTVSDSYRDVRGTWSFTLTVTATKITQALPAVGTATTGKAFSAQLKVLGSHGTVTYSQSAGAPDLRVSTSGAVSAPASLPPGIYKAAGTDSDSLGDTGAWSFTLTVPGTTFAQIAPSTAQTPTGTAFTTQLKFSGAVGSVTYTQTSGTPDLKVSSSGVVSAAASLPTGTYKATGTAKDSHGNAGTWSFTLTVSANAFAQMAPSTARTTTGTAFSTQLKFSGAVGSVTYTQTSGAPDLKVSSSGVVSAAASLPTGTYKAMGTAKDAHGDAGNWSFTLTIASIKLTQLTPSSGRTTTGTSFVGQLKLSGSQGNVTYTQSSGAPDLKVSSSGAVSAPASLPAGIYRASGTARDSLGDTGNWSFTLSVAATKLAQAVPAAGTTVAGRGFSGQLKVSGSHGTVTYTQSAGAPAVRVTSSGAVSAPADLPAGSYRAAGSTRDSYGDSGSWSFTLSVKARKLAQSAPTAGTTTTGKAFAAQIKVSGALGIVTYSQSSGAPQLTISSAGTLSALANLPAGSYKAAGSARDRLGDSGSWSFTLTVAGTDLTQIKPTKAKRGAGTAFSDQLVVSGSKGAVTYTESKGAPQLKVSSSGKITAPDTLRAGIYKASGTERDRLGDTGTWSFALTVTPTKLKQGAPTTGTVTAGKVFTAQLSFVGSHGKLTYTQSPGAQLLSVSSSGKLTAPDTLAAGTYEVFGTVKDAVGDTGTWTFTLTVEGF
ncbi:MAG: beta strand repeat-containing protein [Acidimicrobiales bacterium]